MKNEKLQHSEILAKYFSQRREEPPLLSAPEIEKLLAKGDMLTNNHPLTPSFFRRGSNFNIRKIIMTLSTITGIGLAAYFAFFSSSAFKSDSHMTDQHDRSYKTAQTSIIDTASKTENINPPATKQPTTKAAPRGPWSAGNDQIYADLTPEELARIGIKTSGDSVYSYKLNDKDSVECTQFSEFSIPGITYKGHSIGGVGTTKFAPNGVTATKFYPILMTFSNGKGAAYRIENGKQQETAMIGENDLQNAFRAWLEKPGVLGFHALAFTTSSFFRNDHVEHDTVRVMIGKNFPQPPLFPLIAPIDYPDSVKNALMQIAHYYDGTSSTIPSIALPKMITAKIDTVTPQNVMDEMDSEDNSSTMQHLRSIMSRLNELIPVIVRPKGDSGAPDSNDFIFWYEPSDELFAALPPAQAKAFRQKLAEPPHCLNAPEAVTTKAEVTYCVSDPQEVHVEVLDLSGRIVMSQVQMAQPGDNIAKVDTRTLQSGMYIVCVLQKDGTERSRRIWVQNVH